MAASAAASVAVKKLKKTPEPPKPIIVRRLDSVPYQELVAGVYANDFCQVSVAVLIFVNFFVSAAEAEIPARDVTPETVLVFYVFEWFFAIMFLIELLMNMYGSWGCLFWHSSWNCFDFFIVTISVTFLLVPSLKDVPGIGVLRLFRAFRVFRLFKRVKSLRQIIEGVAASLPGVLNAFLVLGIIMGIWSIMGVQFFSEVAENEFGTFSQGMFTMWQVMTMDSWASGIARPIIYDNQQQVLGIPFFILFIFIAGIVMMNVVVAILLDKYLAVTNADKNNDEEEEEAEVETRKSTRKSSRESNGDKNSSAVHPETVTSSSDAEAELQRIKSQMHIFTADQLFELIAVSSCQLKTYAMEGNNKRKVQDK